MCDINLGKFTVIIASNISFVSLLFSFWYFQSLYIARLAIVPHPRTFCFFHLLVFVFFFVLFAFQFWWFLLTYPQAEIFFLQCHSITGIFFISFTVFLISRILTIFFPLGFLFLCLHCLSLHWHINHRIFKIPGMIILTSLCLILKLAFQTAFLPLSMSSNFFVNNSKWCSRGKKLF